MTEENKIDNLLTDREHNIYNKRLMSICVDGFGLKIRGIKNEIYRNMKMQTIHGKSNNDYFLSQKSSNLRLLDLFT